MLAHNFAMTLQKWSMAIAPALGALAVGLQWAWAAPVTNGWFCTGRLACYLWTRANLPAYMIADLASGGETESFVPIATGIFVQWLVVGIALAWLLHLATRPTAS